MLTKDQAKLILQAHDILALLDDVEELEALEANNPKLADAYCALHRVAFGADPTASRDAMQDDGGSRAGSCDDCGATHGPGQNTLCAN